MASKKKNIKKKQSLRHCFFPALTLFFVFLFIPFLWSSFRVPPRVYLGENSMAGSKNDLAKKINQTVSTFEKTDIVLVLGDKKVNIKPQDIELNIDTAKTIDNLGDSLGLQKISLRSFWRFWQSAFWGFQTPIFYSFSVEKLDQILKERLGEKITLLVDAGITVSESGVTVNPSRPGFVVDKNFVASQIIRNLKNLKNQEIQVSLISLEPGITTEEASKVKNEIDKVISTPFSLRVLENSFSLTRKTLLSWIAIREDLTQNKIQVSENDDLKAINNLILTGQNLLSFQEEKKLTWGIKREVVKIFLEQEIRAKVYRQKKNGLLAFEGSVLKEIQPSQSEVTIDEEKALDEITQSLKNGQSLISLSTIENPADVSLKKAQELGIKNLVSRGESNFTGSPSNRRHNIQVGAEKFNGVVVGKDEEFSFIQNLGPVDASTGYLPELVIKQDKTVPEFGGGMCQVSSTCFRAAVNGGLRVTERQNHAYPVQYYSPQGTDATVYIPKPDLKFLNNTPGPILIQTRMEGNMLYFDFFGQSDERKVELEGPRVWDKKSDGSMKTEWIQKVYTKDGQLMFQKSFLSKYDSPSKYPHPGDEKPPAEKKKKKKGGT